MTIFFTEWASLGRILILGVATYAGLVAMLRISGTRTLSKMNSFDFVVTIALGSTFASAILQRSVALADALLALGLLIGLQWVTTWLSVRYPAFECTVKSEPIVLFAGGEFLRPVMRRAHVTQDEVVAGMRAQGYARLDQVRYVVLETNGDIVAVGEPDVPPAIPGARSTLPAGEARRGG